MQKQVCLLVKRKRLLLNELFHEYLTCVLHRIGICHPSSAKTKDDVTREQLCLVGPSNSLTEF
jgi:hypothetical protein